MQIYTSPVDTVQTWFGTFVPLVKPLLTCILDHNIVHTILTSDKYMRMYHTAFTSPKLDPVYNYDVYEQLGDVTLNKFIVWYIHHRYPVLQCREGVPVVARMRITLVSKHAFSQLANKLGMWPHIRSTDQDRARNKKSLLEDVFEAFVGVTELIMDDIAPGCGYYIVSRILADIYDQQHLDLRYHVLYDAKTRLKELMENYTRDVIGTTRTEYSTSVNADGWTVHTVSIIYKGKVVGTGQSFLKIDAEQYASEQTITHLNSLGFYRPVPDIFNRIVS